VGWACRDGVVGINLVVGLAKERLDRLESSSACPELGQKTAFGVSM
jgi:hypothetical protein